jgi:hypothetical protein
MGGIIVLKRVKLPIPDLTFPYISAFRALSDPDFTYFGVDFS